MHGNFEITMPSKSYTGFTICPLPNCNTKFREDVYYSNHIKTRHFLTPEGESVNQINSKEEVYKKKVLKSFQKFYQENDIPELKNKAMRYQPLMERYFGVKIMTPENQLCWNFREKSLGELIFDDSGNVDDQIWAIVYKLEDDRTLNLMQANNVSTF